MNGTHLVLLTGMLLDAELFAHQKEHLRDVAEVRVCGITAADTVEGMARAVLDEAPERLALAGLSLGEIVAFEILRRAPGRVERPALLDTDARPPLVAGGRQDALCPVELLEEISSGIPGSSLVLIEECGHLSSMERPQAVTALLRYWLQDEEGLRET